MKRKNDIFKAFMAYKFFAKNKEEAKERGFQEERTNAAREKREQQIEKMEQELADSIYSMNRTYDQLAEESRFYDQVTRSNQMLKDLWLYSIYECVSSGFLDDFQSESLVEDLLNKAGIDNMVSVREHIDNLDYNYEYKEYIQNCFEGDACYPGMFWIFLATMSGNNGERRKDSLGFAQNYLDFMALLDDYLSYAYPDEGFTDKGSKLSIGMIRKTGQFLSSIDDELSLGEYQLQHIINPLIEISEEPNMNYNEEIDEE